MSKNLNIPEITTALLDQAHDLQNMAEQVFRLRNGIRGITEKLVKINMELDIHIQEDIYKDPVHNQPVAAALEFNFDKEAVHETAPPKIIPFTGRLMPLTPYMAVLGRSLPEEIPDFRSVLQRDGLILLAWDRRKSEIGERYTAYWVTSTSIPRFYASRPLPLELFSSARPDHKSYAAEDGIEFYGQDAPAYMVHVAPELMMSNPRHKELRPAHIEALKHLGSKVNFDYKYLLKTEKELNLKHRKSVVHIHNYAG